MGDGKDKRTIGKASGVSAQEIATAPDVGALGIGKHNLVQSREVGSPWADHGSICDGRDDTTYGCFMTDAQRAKLLIELGENVGIAETNYKIALEQLRVAELLDKDDDLNWALSLVLDVLALHLSGALSRGLAKLRAGELSEIEQQMLEAGGRGEFDPAHNSALVNAIATVKDKTIETYVNTAVDAGKKGFTKPVKRAVNAGHESGRNQAVNYISTLMDGCDVSFDRFKTSVRTARNDADVVVICEGMHPANHMVTAYLDVLSAKLARFKDSGVTNIGRAETTDRMTHEVTVSRDTRVVWLADEAGNRTLWFHSQDGALDEDLHDDDPTAPPKFQRPLPWKFGPRDPLEAPVLDRPVPREFTDVALQRSEDYWGPTQTFFDPALELVRRWTGMSKKPSKGDPDVPVPRLQLGDVVKQGAS